MKKMTKVLLLCVFVLCLILGLTKGVSYAKYASNSAWNYYLESKDFYLSSDYLDVASVTNVNNNWNLEDIHFNLKNSYNDILATEFDINYTVTCTTSNEKVKCNLNDTGKNTFTGVLSHVSNCVNEVDDTNVSTLDQTECELNGYEWKSIAVTKDLYFNLISDEEYEEITVNINVTSTSPYKKTLLGTFIIAKDKSLNGTVTMEYTNYNDYDRLIVSNNYTTKKCIKITYDSNALRVDTPLDNITSYETDEAGYINSIIYEMEGKTNRSFKFYKQDENIHSKEDFTLIVSDC